MGAHAQGRGALPPAVESRLRSLFENPLVGMAVFGPDGSVLAVNDRLSEMLGSSRDDLLHSDLLAAAHPDDAAEGRTHVGRLLAGETTSCLLSVRFPTGAGATVRTRVFVSAEADDQGALVCLVGMVHDRSHEHESEQALLRTRERHDELVRRLPVGIYTLRDHADGRESFDYCSDRLRDILAVDPEQVLIDASAMWVGIHAEDRATFDRVSVLASQTGQPFRWEGRFVTRDAERWIRIESDPTPLPDGECLWNGVVIDVTDRRQAEVLLRSSEEKLRSVFLNAPLGIFHSLWDGRMLSANPALAALLGYDRPEALVAATSDMTAQAYADPSIRLEILAALRATDGWVHDDAVEWRRRDGKVITVDLTGRKVTDADGRFAYLEGFVSDITERRRAEDALHDSEEKYRFITENVGDVVWTLDPHTLLFTSMSPSVERLRGFTPAEVMADPLDAALTPQARREVRVLMDSRVEQLHTGVPVPLMHVPHEIEQPCKDGSTVWTEVITSVRMNERTGRPELLGVTRDITARKAAAAELRHLAHHDQLTGIYNNRGFHEAAAVRLARLDSSPVAMVFMDLDGLKGINDEYGHAVGDEFAALVVSRLEVADGILLARFETALRRVNDEAGLPYRISASTGVAWWDPATGAGRLDELVNAADGRMYAAKRSRDQSD